MATISTVAALSGIGLAVWIYLRRRIHGKAPLEKAGQVHVLISKKYYMDTLYEDVIVRQGFFKILAGALDWFDKNVVDGIADLSGWFFRNIGKAIGKFQSGQVQAYASGVAFGVLAIILSLLLA